MSKSSSRYKDTQVFDWEAEPHDERPSEFAQSTGYQLHSGFCVAPVTSSRRHRSGGGSGLVLWLMIGGVLGLGVAGLFGLMSLVRA